MIRAMWRLRIAGKLDRATYAQYKSMIFSGLPIAGAEKDARPRFVIQHLREEVEKRIEKEVTNAVESVVGERVSIEQFKLADWLMNLSFDDVVTWIIENWQVIVQILAGLMVFLQAEYEAE